MRSFLLLAAMMAGVQMQGSGMSSYSRYKPQRKPQYEPLNIEGIPSEIPKGHKTEAVTFVINHGNFEYSINITISYGTSKSRLKKIAQLKGILGEYIAKTSEAKLIEFGQFEIVRIAEANDANLKQFVNG